MIKKPSEFNVELRENMRGGDGVVEMTSFVTKEELNNKVKELGGIVI